jgi:DNA-directed RNA polymerase subunit alpha
MLDTFILPPTPTEGRAEALKPNIRVLESTDTYGKLVIEPLQRGYGITIGNPLRRILLSSIKGSAITWVKIDGVVHEYTTIPHVKEEVMELLLNIKRIRIRSQSERTGKMRLEVAGEGRVCAGDISTSSDFQIVNPELPLATLDSQQARLSIEFNVENGVGYQPAIPGEKGSGLPVGILPVDAIFNPVRKVNYNIERTRVAHVTDYERLVLEVWTDGTISPLDAVQESAETLVNHFFLLSNLNRTTAPEIEHLSTPVSPEIYQTPIEKLDLSPRTLNCLKRAHISKVGEILERSDNELLKIRNFGDKSLEELHQRLAERGVIRERKEAPGRKASEAHRTTNASSDTTEVADTDISALVESTLAGVLAEPSAENPEDDAMDFPEDKEEPK